MRIIIFDDEIQVYLGEDNVIEGGIPRWGENACKDNKEITVKYVWYDWRKGETVSRVVYKGPVKKLPNGYEAGPVLVLYNQRVFVFRDLGMYAVSGKNEVVTGFGDVWSALLSLNSDVKFGRTSIFSKNVKIEVVENDSED